ncbi:MAG: class I SAM-dependent methyltransferase [Methanomicrobiales archaeon]|nr:class I SAM-dependent methyltransferase [Methanomicrobiales archaeon]
MRENDIRPDSLFDRYLALLRDDREKYFRHARFQRVPCPACGSTSQAPAFRKLDFSYETCTSCGTLFVNPRPEREAFTRYSRDSASVRFWATDFYRQTEESRRTLLIRPKAHLVRGMIRDHGPRILPGACTLDIGAGYGVFCEELQAVMRELAVVAIEPSPLLAAQCRKKGIPTIEKFVEDVSSADLGGRIPVAATSFELLEHLVDPGEFLTRCRNLLPGGALLILTTLNWNGFDLQVLRDRSRSICPPAHINFFTPASLHTSLERHGFQPLQITTPGRLDVDIASKDLAGVTDPFIREILVAGDEVKAKFQEFLREVGMSSHMMAVARRR